MNAPGGQYDLSSLLYGNNGQNDAAYAAQLQAMLQAQQSPSGAMASYLGKFNTTQPDNSLLLLLTDE